MIELCNALEGNTTLTELSAGSHSLSAEDAEAFAGVLRSKSALKSLCLGNSSFGDDGLAVLAEGLAGGCFCSDTIVENPACILRCTLARV